MGRKPDNFGEHLTSNLLYDRAHDVMHAVFHSIEAQDHLKVLSLHPVSTGSLDTQHVGEETKKSVLKSEGTSDNPILVTL